MERCRVAIKFGSAARGSATTLNTRCRAERGHGGMHVGEGLAEFPYQVISWLPGDRREYETDRDDERAWEDPR